MSVLTSRNRTLPRATRLMSSIRQEFKRSTWPYSALSVATVLACWYWATSTRQLPTLFLPSMGAVAKVAGSLWTQGYAGTTLPIDILTSLGRLGLGFCGAVIIGVPVGLAIGLDHRAHQIVDPWIQFYYPLPPLSYLGLMILWFGVGETSKVLLLMLSVLPPIVIAAGSAARSVRLDRVQGAQSLGLSRAALFQHVILPSCLPGIVTGCRIAIGVGYTTLIAAEMINSDSGLGAMIMIASNHLATAIAVVGILVMGLTGLLIDTLIRLIQGWLVPWAGRA